MEKTLQINKHYTTDKLRADYAHVGLMEVQTGTLWIARKRFGVHPIRISHARLLQGGSDATSTVEKDRFLCYWFHTPNTGSGYVHGYPIEWEEGHLLVRLDPHWSYSRKQFIPSSDTLAVEANIEEQFAWGRQIFHAYLTLKPGFALSWHMIGPRPADSMFYVQRVEPS